MRPHAHGLKPQPTATKQVTVEGLDTPITISAHEFDAEVHSEAQPTLKRKRLNVGDEEPPKGKGEKEGK